MININIHRFSNVNDNLKLQHVLARIMKTKHNTTRMIAPALIQRITKWDLAGLAEVRTLKKVHVNVKL